MSVSSKVLAILAFVTALGLQLVLNDIPGAFVSLAVAPLAGVAAKQAGWPRRFGLGFLPSLGGLLGFVVARLVEDRFFVSYGVIADLFAFGLLVPAFAVYAATWWIARRRSPGRT